MADACWVLTDEYGGGRDEPVVAHYLTETRAKDAARPDGYRPRQLDAPCLTLTCSCCEEPLQDDDYGHAIHLADQAEATEIASAYDWTLTDGVATCPTCVTGPCDREADTHG
ncbi:hypothetical protein [Spongiactinospora sp. TRM90649]|uniref:hypothetical protein n=1 Tax=Spongiactinospora sp. TRM90649 TaxID=3031114 RepID=UPI0023F8A996|nr:hypothetical protein [Spongiactinospora sp. TRM90649]MDF5758577.1 hypothetical protein [Spongiactinospora sp. TRM90649]